MNTPIIIGINPIIIGIINIAAIICELGTSFSSLSFTTYYT